MKKYELIPTVSIAVLSLFSCSIQEENSPLENPEPKGELQETIITATLDEGTAPETRTSLVTDETGAPVAIYWTPGDKIKIFSDGQSAEFTSINSEPAPVARFRGLVSFVTGADDGQEIAYVWGLYPYREDAVYNEPQVGVSRTATITTTLPAVQTGKAGTFDDGYAITIGRSESLSIPFKSVYTLMRFTVSSDDIKSVTFKGNNNEAIAGRFTVGMDDSASPVAPIVRSIESPETEITLSMADGTCFEVGKLYYIVMLPTTFSSGFTFTLTRADGSIGEFKLSTTSPVTLARNKFSNVSNLDTKVSSWTETVVPDNEIWYTTASGEPVSFSSEDLTAFGITGNIVKDDHYALVFENPLTTIPNSIFDRFSDLKTVSLPDVTGLIDDYAFSGCTRLQKVDFGSGLKRINQCAFRYCTMLEEINLPEGLETIMNYAFAHCSSLKTVRIPSSVTTISFNPFNYCYNLEAFTGENSMICDENPFLGAGTGCCLVDSEGTLISFACASIPEGYLYKVEDNVKTIGLYSFAGAQCYGLDLNKAEVVEPRGIYDCANFSQILIHSTTTTISRENFSKCPSLDFVQLDVSSVPTIGESCFLNSSDSYIIRIYDYMYNDFQEDSGWGAFADHLSCKQSNRTIWYHLEGDETTTIDAGRMDFGTEFKYSSSYTPSATNSISPTVSCPEDVSIGTIAFLVFDGPVTTIPANAFTTLSDKLDYLSAPRSITTIGDNAFKNCSKLKNFPIISANSVTSVGESAFEGCTLMPGATLRNISGNNIGKYAFRGCKAISKVTLGAISYINLGAFMQSGITALDFPTNALEVVNNYAFFGCNSLTQFGQTEGAMISEKLRYIGNSAFYETGLTNVELESNQLLVHENAFNGSKVKTFKSNATRIYKDAFFRAPIETLELPNIKVLEARSLAGIWNLQTLKLGSGLSSIGAYLFYDDLETYTSYNHDTTDIWFDGPLPETIDEGAFLYTDNSSSSLYNNLFKFKSIHVPSAYLSEYRTYFSGLGYDATDVNKIVAQ